MGKAELHRFSKITRSKIYLLKDHLVYNILSGKALHFKRYEYLSMITVDNVRLNPIIIVKLKCSVYKCNLISSTLFPFCEEYKT